MENDTYSVLREFADSWWLVVMFGFFILVVLFTFRPGSRRVHRDIADIPLRDDDPSRLRDDPPTNGRAGPRNDAPRPSDDETSRRSGAGADAENEKEA